MNACSVRSVLVAAVLACTFPADRAMAAPGFAEWLAEFRTEAAAAGITAETLDRALDGLEPVERVVDLDRSQPEATSDFASYAARAVSPERISAGATLLVEHRELLDRVERTFGVPRQTVIALWGIESNFGTLTGRFPVIASLATLAFEGRRAELFRGELLAALRMLDDRAVPADAFLGSWAGAVGQPQFMPSTFLAYAVDFDRDGRRDIWNDTADVLASIANYLASAGWVKNGAWGIPVRVPSGLEHPVASAAKPRSVNDWRRLGVRHVDGTQLAASKKPAMLVRPDGAAGPSFIVYENFQVLKIWNRSNRFALAVGLLSERLRDS